MKKNLLDVINVGQGDSFVLRPNECCMYHRYEILVDLGDGNKDITQFINNDVKIMLSHSHEDHCKGFKYFLGKDYSKIKGLILPLYHNEVILIAKFLLDLKGINKNKNKKFYGLVKYLKSLIDGHHIMNKILENMSVQFVYEGLNSCNHITYFNPPLNAGYHKFSENMEQLEKIFREIFIADKAQENYNKLRLLYEGRIEQWKENKNDITYILKHDTVSDGEFKEDVDSSEVEFFKAKADFIAHFFLEYYSKIKEFNSNPSKVGLAAVVEEYKLQSNQASIVFKYTQEDNISILFTGDADIKVLNRIINRGYDVRAKYLKVPHHGSKNNLNKDILGEIEPEIAIISHNNGLFGRAKDPHPNKPILDLFKAHKISLILTNDVVKSGRIYYKKTPLGKFDSYVEVVE